MMRPTCGEISPATSRPIEVPPTTQPSDQPVSLTIGSANTAGNIERGAPGQDLRDAQRGDDDAAVERARLCFRRQKRFLSVAGSMPLDLSTAAAAGPDSALISASAASLSFADALKPAA